MKAKRRENDAYYTRRRFDVDALLKHLDLPADGTYLEPCVGAGDIARYLPGRVITNDIEHRCAADYHFDATAPATWKRLPAVDWVISNPPFNVAHRIIPFAYEHARVGVAMMLRLSWLEPTNNRRGWLAGHPLTRQIVLPRFSFDGSGQTDSVTCAWMIWEKGAAPTVFVEPYDGPSVPRTEKKPKPSQATLFT